MRTVDNQVLAALHQIRDAIKNKECCGGGSDSSSKEITIDDVVKFIHDEVENTPMGEKFPYTTWNDIPNYDDVNDGVCKTNNSVNIKNFSSLILNLPNYIIGFKEEFG